MKRIVCLTSLLMVFALARRPSTAEAGRWSTTSEVRLARQLENYVSYPDRLGPANRSARAMVRFRLTADDRMEAVRVFSGDDTLTASLQRQLSGKRLFTRRTDAPTTYLARLHFRRP